MNIQGAKKYCCDDISLIENYDKAINDKTQLWDCHHRLEIDENKTVEQLKEEGKYYNRPADELIFLTHGEHTKLHAIGKTYSEETKQKLSKANKGKKMSDEARQKMSIAKKGKKQSAELVSKRTASIKEYYKTHDGYYKNKKLPEETKKKMSEAHKGKRPANLDAILERQKLYGSPLKGKHRVRDANGKYHYE